MKQKEWWYLNLGPLHIYPPSGYQLTDSERERESRADLRICHESL